MMAQSAFFSHVVFAAEQADEVIRVPLSPTAVTVLAVLILLYVAVLFAISVFASGKVVNEEDYLVAGRSLPLFLCWGSLIATWFGASSMTAAPDAAKREGLYGVILDPFACSVTLILAGLLFARPLWRLKLLTVGDFFRKTYGTSAEVMAGCIQVPAFFSWIAVQFKALADVQEVYFGIPRPAGILIGSGIIVAYTLVGGMWSVTLTDTLIVMIAFCGLMVIAYNTFAAFGGGSVLSGVDRLVAESDPQALSLLPPELATAAVLTMLGTWATGLGGNIPGQDLQQRIFSAKDARTAAAACIWAGAVYFVFGMIPTSLGLIARVTNPDFKGNVLQLMAVNHLSETFAVIFIISFVSLIVSTATGAMLAPATILSHNLLGRLKLFRGRGLLAERLCVLFVASASILYAFSSKTYMDLLKLTLQIQFVAMLVPLTMGLYGRPRSRWCGLLSMGLGIGFFLPRYLFEVWLFAVPPELVEKGVNFGDYLASRFPAYGGLLKDLAGIPAEFYGITASIAGYGLAQGLFYKSQPINDPIREVAWPDHLPDGSPKSTITARSEIRENSGVSQ